jgi:hypothetical protein
MRKFQNPILLAVLLPLLALSVNASGEFPSVKFVAVRSPVSHGGEGLVTIHTKPGTPCVISVIYK